MRKLTLVLITVFTTHTWGWGPTGHRVIGDIAEQRLSEQGKKLVNDLLGNQTLAQISNYMDFIRSNDSYKEISNYHYVNIEDGKTYFSSDKDPKGDVIKAICKYYDELISTKISKEQKQFALKALVHFVGDMHQPLHVGKKEDLGGNKIRVKWFNDSTNLHKVWDERLIESQKLSYTEYSHFIYKSGDDTSHMENASLFDQIAESMEARTKIYNNLADFKTDKDYDLSYKYIYDNIDLVNKQLLKGGIHLAVFINKAAQGLEYPECKEIKN